MLYPTAGCRLFIADLPDTLPGDVAPGAWVEIGETEALGMLGVEWDLQDVTAMNCRGEAEEAVMKALMRRPPMPIILGNDPEDAGQAILWAASRSLEAFPFRLVFPDGAISRRWSALIIALFEVFDSANNVMKLQADLRPVSTIEKEIA